MDSCSAFEFVCFGGVCLVYVALRLLGLWYSLCGFVLVCVLLVGSLIVSCCKFGLMLLIGLGVVFGCV